MDTLNAVARFAGQPTPEAVSGLPLEHPEAAIRYWCVLGLAQLETEDAVEAFLDDGAPLVRVAAAGACLRRGWSTERALNMLTAALASDAEWIRLQAATALDEAGEHARPAIPALEEALKDRDNKYVARVANHALNVLEGTEHQVR